MDRHPQLALITQLVRDSLYEVDSDAVADAIVARILARHALPAVRFRNDKRPAPVLRAPAVRSFRPSTRVRSFHLSDRSAAGHRR